MAITRSQMARQLLAGGGLSLEDAKMMAPKGEFLAYINPKEADMLRSAGGSGIMTAAGIPSFVDFGGSGTGYGSAADTFSSAGGGGSTGPSSDDGGSGFDDTADVNLGLAGGRTAFTQPDNDGGGLSNIINYISDNKKGILQNIIGTALLGPAYPMIGLGLAGIGKLRSNNLIDDTDEGGGIKDKFKDTLDRFKQLGDPNKYLANKPFDYRIGDISDKTFNAAINSGFNPYTGEELKPGEAEQLQDQRNKQGGITTTNTTMTV